LIRSEIALSKKDTIIWLGGLLFTGFIIVIGLLLKIAKVF